MLSRSFFRPSQLEQALDRAAFEAANGCGAAMPVHPANDYVIAQIAQARLLGAE